MSVEEGPVYRDVSVIRTIADGSGDFRGWAPHDVTHNPVSGQILVTDGGPRGDCIRVFSDNPPYPYITQYGQSGEGEGEYHGPHAITCDSEGRVIVTDYRNRRLQVLSPTGQYVGQVTGTKQPWWVCVDGEDNMYVAVIGNAINVYDPQGGSLPSTRRRGLGEITISGEHLYEMNGNNNRLQIHINSLTDRSDVKTVPLPEQIPRYMYPRITACRDGRLLITGRGWRPRVGADVRDEDHTYIYILDSEGHNLTQRPCRYEGHVWATTLLYDNTLVVVDTEGRLQLVTLPGINPPVKPIHPMRVTSVQNLCLYKIRSMIRHSRDVHKLPEWVAPGLISKLMELYPQ